MITLNAEGRANITVSDIDNGTTDNCAISSVQLSTTEFSVGNIGENTITLTATDVSGNSGSASAIVIVEPFSAITGISDLRKELVIYPNPVVSTLNLENLRDASISSMRIIDLSGNKVQELSNDLEQVDVSFLSSGVYFLMIQSPDGQLSQFRFLKE